MTRPVIRDVIIPGSARVVVHTWETATVDARCGRCGHEQPVARDGHTARCKACGRADRAADRAGRYRALMAGPQRPRPRRAPTPPWRTTAGQQATTTGGRP